MRTVAFSLSLLLLPALSVADVINIDVRSVPNRYVVVSPVPGQGTNLCTINVGDTVTWTWFNQNHSVTSDDDGLTFDSGVQFLGHQFSHTFNAPGDYGYHCILHGFPGGAQFGRVTVVKAPCLGDLNGDDSVDIGDLALLLANFGTTSGATAGQGDSDTDGDVDIEDLAFLLSRFGNVC